MFIWFDVSCNIIFQIGRQSIHKFRSRCDAITIKFFFFESFFKNIKKDEDAWEIVGEHFTIVHYPDNALATHCMVNLYGENAIYAIVDLAKTIGFQVFDTGLGEMLDLDDPSKNGYENFQRYMRQVLGKK